MANILIFSKFAPFPENHSGYTLRTLPLCRELARKHRCFLFTFGYEDDRVQGLIKTKVFDQLRVIPPPTGRKGVWRYFFLQTGNQTRVARPREYQRIRRQLSQCIEDWDIDLMIIYSSILAEYTKLDKKIPKIMDIIDCETLAITRAMEFEGHLSHKSLKERFRDELFLYRARTLEESLLDQFDFVTTVSPKDRKMLCRLSPMGKERILVSPNGIPSEVLWFKTNTMKIEGAIAFWGSLSFLPNRIAVEYFYHQVFVSYLADTPITWYIIGKNPEQWIRDLPLRHRNIKVTGYIDDLYGLISRIPIMINPMQIGGGIKNKVLEAFALERLVISTSLGMEAIPAQPGIHYIQADKSKEFANFIKQYASDVQAQHTIGQQAKSFVMQNYTWRTLGDQFNNLINQCLSSRQQNYSIKDNKTVKIFRKGNKYY